MQKRTLKWMSETPNDRKRARKKMRIEAARLYLEANRRKKYRNAHF